MIPELGLFALIAALGLSALVSIYPLYGASVGNQAMMRMARPLTYGVFLMLLGSFVSLCWSFYSNDFTVTYVASNSTSLLLWYYRITAVWGSHEGSLLLWVFIQSAWAAAVARLSKGMPLESVSRVLAVMGMISVGFLLFIILTSNPFLRTLPFFPVQGRDLNPLLQDPGLIIHPPMLYMGYVGFSVAFAFAIASLMTGRLDTAWARWSRPWTIAAWSFLTPGIALGSWWAYYELGWGGWWFWDPVENASFMPWLAGTALMHSLSVTEKRGTFKAWTVLLAIAAFSLSLLGTFLVRSGVLVSVHAFASDPSRGMFILGFLVVVIGGSLLLYALRGAQIRSRGNYSLFSRENMLFANNILLVTGLLVVLIGTLLPLVHKQLGLGSVSIGETFFNTLFTWLMVPFAFVLGIGPLVRWKRDNISKIKKQLIISAIASVIFAFGSIYLFASTVEPLAVLGMWMAAWIVILHGFELYERATHRHSLVEGLGKLGRSHWAMVFGHIGLAVSIIGITLVSNYDLERDVRLAPGQSVNVKGYDFYFAGLRDADGPNYDGYVADFKISKNNIMVTTLHAEKRIYTVAGSMMTEAAIDSGITRDLYVAMGEKLGDGAWAVRIYYKPFVNWMWFGALLMAIGGVFAISDKRYRFRKKAQITESKR
ncbi:heme lyase CcmF/NrfE family subunit [Photobacterium damselae subsp. piscicida]|uniref:Cytochrome c-type biogenesis protein CcmF n=1 Tax=Photobacterium damsela subsp. piscicida TaxID=38294 RepID=A0A1Q9H6K4_PHODP|nr:heme lyase CcmF/NrfE family subunit [Photobacterium damselae]MBE8129777.1 heme lyase CcmF/NrfE family subunit [Photobacterium damselae subsp. piscicida]OLQ83420.1 c-type cytochrome biogenesis protein CcmF [Photobacterium damselae subsp. piscicida]PSV73189.1 heme lyase CcmF/NrfE family subunit [Photobacterium damselae]PSW77568.1 heme lyase CcmF/NrfE family subunit [Photobacterium damselae]QOD51973.1 heme lyase CcmF/NrfE family subunit [Photobacterium damselae subsp. piscicida]